MLITNDLSRFEEEEEEKGRKKEMRGREKAPLSFVVVLVTDKARHFGWRIS